MSESARAEAREALANDPTWHFDDTIDASEQERYTADIVAACKTVYDPEIPCDIYELGLIYKVAIDEPRQANVEMTLTAPGCPVAGEITASLEAALGTVPGISGAHVEIVFDPPWNQGRMSDEARVSLDMF